MTEGASIRRERIERLLCELEYEVTRGVMEQEIEPEMWFKKLIPGGPTGEVGMTMTVRPVQRGEFFGGSLNSGPKLRVVGGKEEK